MDPTWASFYIVCPIPGTEQYDDFLDLGLITERNLDRFDTTCLTWRHPSLSKQRLSEMLFECYRKFFSLRHALHNMRQLTVPMRRESRAEKISSLAMSLFVRYCALRHTHPMSGGVMRVQRDCADDFLPLRKHTFGCELAPLPRSLALPAAEQLLTSERQFGRGDVDRLSHGLRAFSEHD